MELAIAIIYCAFMLTEIWIFLSRSHFFSFLFLTLHGIEPVNFPSPPLVLPLELGLKGLILDHYTFLLLIVGNEAFAPPMYTLF